MILPERWIWLPEKEYPDSQMTKYSGFDTKTDGNYTVAEFTRTYHFDKKVISLNLIFSGDTEFQLFCNNKFIATGPASVGGDFIGNERPRPDFYKMQKIIELDTHSICFFARVKMMPVKICEYSKGHGGFMLSALVTFEDGTKEVISTDSSWNARKNYAYKAPDKYDSRLFKSEYTFAEEIDDIWHTELAPVSVRVEEEIYPEEKNKVILMPHEEKEVVLQFDKIYAGFLHVFAKTGGNLYAEVHCKEIDECGTTEQLIFSADNEYRGFLLHSVGNFFIKLKNDSDEISEFSISLISTNYPVKSVAEIVTDDLELNTVLDVCRHTLKICRQLHHLDSPRHCEPLACTGDYYIETLMTLFSFGDMALAEFDVIRTAKLLRNNDGRMFHTTYSLIWVKMLYDVYMFTGKKELLCDCVDALVLLLRRFEKYMGDNGLIENPPDFMFVDWIYIDGISMHHPPKALGQTCLNMFYYGALDTAVKIYTELSETGMAIECTKKKENLKKSINSLLFDEERGLYFEGLNTKTSEDLICPNMPQNVDKRYYMKHSNILAVYFGVSPKANEAHIIDRVMTDTSLGDIQPYFAHYLLEAVYKSGLREKYTLKLLDVWKQSVRECSKGLVEGFVKPEPTYSFDHSHAWGGTPLYSLPKSLLGFEINKPGLLEVTLTPSLLGLRYAKIEVPTPHGNIVCEMRKGNDIILTHPDEITVHLNRARIL